MDDTSVLFRHDLSTVPLTITERKPVSISPSSIITFNECFHKWKLVYLLKKSKRETSVDLLFGIAAHEAVQKAFSQKDYTLTYDFFEIFKGLIDKNRDQLKEKDFDKLDGLLMDAHNIFDNFLIEDIDLSEIEDVKVEEKMYEKVSDFWMFSGRLDLMYKIAGKEKHRIIDIKTTKSGWDQEKKNDISTLSQLVLYKWFICKKYGYNTRDVGISYLFLKKKSRKPIELFDISAGPRIIEKCLHNMVNTIKLIEKGFFVKSFDKKACRWCEFANGEFCIGDRINRD